MTPRSKRTKIRDIKNNENSNFTYHLRGETHSLFHTEAKFIL